MEKEKVFNIIQVDFDGMENHIGSAICKSSVGIVFGVAEADKVVSDLMEQYGNRSEGWDGEQYPFYYKQELYTYDKSKVNKYGRRN